MDIDVKNIFVTSLNRDLALYPYGNAYTLYFTNPIKQIQKVELLHASVPNTLYNITDGTGIISLSNTTSGIGDPLTTFSIPLGFYDADGLASEIQSASSNICDIAFQYRINEGKFLMTRTNPFSMRINTDELADAMGYPRTSVGVVLNSINVPVSTGLDIPLYSDHASYRDLEFIKSPQIVSLNPIEGIFLDIPELRTICNEDAHKLVSNDGTYSGQNMTRSFGIIPMDVSSGSIKRFKKSSDYDMTIYFPYPIQKLDRISIRWIDANGKTVSFNGLENNSFLLRFHLLRTNTK
jgi:hypothetical protein